MKKDIAFLKYKKPLAVFQRNLRLIRDQLETKIRPIIEIGKLPQGFKSKTEMLTYIKKEKITTDF